MECKKIFLLQFDRAKRTVAASAASAISYRDDGGLNWRRPDLKKLRRSILTDLTCSVLQQDILYYCPACWRRHLPPSPTTDCLSSRMSMDSSWKTTVRLEALQPRTSAAKGTPQSLSVQRIRTYRAGDGHLCPRIVSIDQRLFLWSW